MTFKQRYGAIYKDVWALHEQAANYTDGDQYIKMVDAVYKPYKDTPYQKFVQKMLIAVMGEVDRLEVFN